MIDRIGQTRPLAAVLLAIALVGASTILLPPSAEARFNPSWNWSALQTDHFTVYHHDGFRATALRAAAIAEGVHDRLTAVIGWEPEGRTHLVLADATDYANGFSSPFPYNRVVIYLAAPLELPGFGLNAGEEWLRLVITHEYAHTLQMDMASGVPSALRAIFGRIYFPNAHQPLWLIEGLATFEETEGTAGGRGRSSYGEMVLRTAALAGKFPPLGKMAVFPERWPSGETPYLFGESFTRFLSKRYGREKLAELSRVYAGRTLPFLVNSTAQRVFGKRYGELYGEWKAELSDRFRGQAAEIRGRGETSSTPLTKRGSLTLAPAWSPSGSMLAFFSSTQDEEAGLYVMNADGSGVRRLADFPAAAGSSGVAPAWSPSGRVLYYSRLEVADSASVYSDLYCFDLGSSRETRLTCDLRARDPHPSPDGTSLLFVAGGPNDGSRIARLPLDPTGTAAIGDPVTLVPAGDLRFALPRHSPDGSMICASATTVTGETSIRILDGAGGPLQTIDGGGALCGSPAWTPDGRHLLFSWDRGGIFNIFAAETATGAVSRVTNVVSGAFSPAPSPDGGSLAFSGYSADGFDIHAMPLDREAWTPESPAPLQARPATAEPLAVATREVSSFSPATLLPRYWLPVAGWDDRNGTTIGLATSGSDPLDRHAYGATVLYSPRTGRIPFSFSYAYDGLYPTLILGVADRDRIHGGYFGGWVDEDGENDYVEREMTAQIGLSIPFAAIRRSHAFFVGARYRELAAVTDEASLLPPRSGTASPRAVPPGEGGLVSSLLAYSYAGVRRPPASIGPEDGRLVRISWEHADEAFGSDLSFDRGTVDWREFINLPWRHHVVSLRLFGGTAGGDLIPQRLFRIGGDSSSDLLLGSDSEGVSLRGYPAGAIRGQNALVAGAEYRFPILTIERGAATAPFYLRRLHASLFAETGDAWDGGGSLRPKTGVGATVALDLTFAWALPMTIRLVAAKGLGDEGEEQLYFTVSAPL
jgi:hypothetical protein